MANTGGVTMTGLAELRAAVDRLPETVTQALRAVAWRSSRNVMAAAKANLAAKTHATGRTGRSIRVIEEADEKRFVVIVPGDSAQPANLPMWLEYGTKHMQARAYLRPAMDAESAHYLREMARVSVDVVRKALT